MKQLSKHLTFANVISCIALFVALSGAAYAASATLGKKSVKTQNLANGSVTTLKLRGGSVTNLKLRNGAVTGAKIANATVGSSQLASGAVRTAQLGGGVVTEGKLKDGAVGEKKLVNGAVTSAKLGKEAVTTEKLSSSLLGGLARNVTYVSATSPSDDTTDPKRANAHCPVGKQVIGGGARVISPLGEEAKTVALTESGVNEMAHPLSFPLSYWTASAREIAPEEKPWAVEAFAICAEFVLNSK